MKRLCLSILLVLQCALSAVAQDTESRAPFVESIGEATAYGLPTHADFWFHARRSAENLETAAKDAQEFETLVRAQITTAELRPTEMEFTTPIVGALESQQGDSVFTSARLRFALSQYQSSKEGIAEFAALCDRLKALAVAVDADVEGPVILTTNQQPLIQTAAEAAAELAYPPADSLAKALKNAVYAVDTLQIEEVLWNQPRDGVQAEPNIRQISCTVKVRALYILSQQ